MARGATAFVGLPCRTIWTRVLPGPVATYNEEPNLSGWYNVKAEDDEAYVCFGHSGPWDLAVEGIWIVEGETICRFLDGTDLNYYTTAGRVRLELIEFVPLMKE
ncbi:MAG: hypothetical protein M0R37_12500 [Bacteroidales bacterium]|nr:hypothetical protein [Bacteroidales bacterium]